MKHLLILLILLVQFSFPGCKKFENDERAIHLRSVKCRLVHHSWRNYGIRNYIKLTNTPGNIPTIAFSDDGRFFGTIYPFWGEDGNWQLTDHKQSVEITNSNGHKVKYKIIRLDNYSDPEGSILELKDDSLILSFHSHDTFK